MLNAHLRFGSLTYFRRTEETTTHFQLHLDRFIGEVAPDPPRQAKAHLLSVIGGETQISAIVRSRSKRRAWLRFGHCSDGMLNAIGDLFSSWTVSEPCAM